MPSVLLGNIAYGTNDPRLVKWIWIGRNCKYLMGMPLDFHGWGDFSNRAVSLVGTRETRPVELLQERVAHVGMRCASQGRSHSHLGWISSHCCADSCMSCCLDCQREEPLLLASGKLRLLPCDLCGLAWVWWCSGAWENPRPVGIGVGYQSYLLCSFSLMLRFNICGFV